MTQPDTSRWYQGNDPTTVVEILTTPGGSHYFRLWRAETGFAGWFSAAYLDRYAPFTHVNQPAWAVSPHRRERQPVPEKTEAQRLAEAAHDGTLEQLRELEQEAIELQQRLTAARAAVQQTRKQITQLT